MKKSFIRFSNLYFHSIIRTVNLSLSMRAHCRFVNFPVNLSMSADIFYHSTPYSNVGGEQTYSNGTFHLKKQTGSASAIKLNVHSQSANYQLKSVHNSPYIKTYTYQSHRCTTSTIYFVSYQHSSAYFSNMHIMH